MAGDGVGWDQMAEGLKNLRLVLWAVGDGTVSQSDLVRHESWRDNVHCGATEMN